MIEIGPIRTRRTRILPVISCFGAEFEELLKFFIFFHTKLNRTLLLLYWPRRKIFFRRDRRKIKKRKKKGDTYYYLLIINPTEDFTNNNYTAWTRENKKKKKFAFFGRLYAIVVIRIVRLRENLTRRLRIRMIIYPYPIKIRFYIRYIVIYVKQ